MEIAVRSPLREINNQSGQSGVASLSEEKQLKFNKLIIRAKELASQGMIKNALEYNKRALAIYRSEKLVKRVKKMEAYLAQCSSSSEEEGDDMAHVGNGFYLYRDLYDKLYEHQREGIRWMWKLYKGKKGGILGDDMGLGKTIQVIAFLSGMFDAEQCNSVLIVLPVAVIMNWEKEFEKWAPGIRVVAFHGASKRERERALTKTHRRGGVVLTSYGMVITSAEQLSKKDGREFVWDYIILDEGHKIKNPSTKGSKSIHSIPAKNRLLLSGTPIQNNLKEMWALFDWTHQGTLLGTARTFSMEYEQPITRARQKDATSGEQRLGGEIANSLKKIITPYFLRRTKAEVTRKKKSNETTDSGEQGRVPEMPTFTRKNDLICWVFLSDLQQKIYQAFVETEDVKDLLNSTRSPLTALVVLKKICDHPRLMTMRQCASMGLSMDDPMVNADEMDENTATECAANRIRHMSSDVLISESGKLLFLADLLDNLTSDGHRALVFSQSRKMLDIIQKVVTSRGHKVIRLDGTVRQLSEREDIINKFSRNKSYTVFLLTTQVGGVGLTLTAADRVIIYDPSWNPATDAQAVDRAFRIGQEKNVVIYRLITCGSIEEKIYRRQIFKDSITKQTTGDSNNPYRYFSRQELHELFVLDNPHHSTTQIQLQDLHDNQRKTDTRLDAHIAFLMSLDMFGISDHDLMFSQEAMNDEDGTEEAGHDYINSRVSKAQQAISQESEENYQMTQQLGKYPAHEVNQPRTKRNLGNEDVPQRPPGAPAYNINLRELHEKSMEGEELSDSDNSDTSDVNESISHLTVHESPSRSLQTRSPMMSPRSPTPPPDGRISSDHDTTGSHPDFSPENKLVKQGAMLPSESELINCDSPMKSEPNVKSALMTLEDNNMSRNAKRLSAEHVDSDTDFQDNKKGKLDNSGSDSVIDLDPEDSDVLDIKPQVKTVIKSSGIQDERHSIEENPPHTLMYPLDAPEVELAGYMETKENTSLAKKTPKKRRQSVCVAPTSSRKFSADELRNCTNQLGTPVGGIVREEIVFSPQASEPIVNMSHSENKSPPSFNENEYETFAKAVPMNSTVLPGTRKPPKFNLDEADDDEEDDEEEDDEEEDDEEGEEVEEDGNGSGDQPEDRDDEEAEDGGEEAEEDSEEEAESMQEVATHDVSDVMTTNTRRTRKAIIESSDEEMPQEEDGVVSVEDMSRSSEELEESRSLKDPSLPHDEGDTEDEENKQREDDDVVEEPEEEVEDPAMEDDVEEEVEDVTEAEEEEVADVEEDSEEESDEDISEEDQQRYIDFMRKSRELYKQADYMHALQYALDALDIYSGDEKAQMYAQKLKSKLLKSTRS